MTTQNNLWLEAADFLSVSNPEVDAAMARYLRQRAFITSPEFRSPHLERSLAKWEKAASERPYWPFYPLGALEAAMLLDRPAEDIQQRFASIVAMAPNERSMDTELLSLAVLGWHKLLPAQRDWSLARLDSSPGPVRHYVFGVAEQLKRRSILCASLPWAKYRYLCK
ncbi:hypothetical protein ACQUQU_05575 [Thalassolituus sp. LLYu03]|uniref:hypothetical protein n=1 Tax=Thalassolituus sp. LLYu03 TaxID=3421656 RepID=UPI003D298E28